MSHMALIFIAVLDTGSIASLCHEGRHEIAYCRIVSQSVQCEINYRVMSSPITV